MKLLILDRDGTLNRRRDDHVASPDEWEAIPGALEAVARLNQGGWHVVLATNQSGIGRGLFDMAALNAVHTKMHRQLAAVGARVDAVFFCPHAPEDACQCRKPEPGLFEQIGVRFGGHVRGVPAAGNAVRHVLAASQAGCQPHLLLNGRASDALEDRDSSLTPWVDPASPADPRADLSARAEAAGFGTVALPADTQLHADLSAFADWLLAADALAAQSAATAAAASEGAP